MENALKDVVIDLQPSPKRLNKKLKIEKSFFFEKIFFITLMKLRKSFFENPISGRVDEINLIMNFTLGGNNK